MGRDKEPRVQFWFCLDHQSLEVRIVTEEVLVCPKDSSSARINQLYPSTHKDLLFPSHNSPYQVKNKSEVFVLYVKVDMILKVQK